MFAIDTLIKQWARRTRDRLVRGLRSELADTRAELARALAAVDQLRSEVGDLRAGLIPIRATATAAVHQVANIREKVALGARANAALESVGALLNVSAEERAGDVTRVGAMGYFSWESAVAAYRPAFQVAIDFLRSVSVRGPVVEFGTCTGFTARLICDLMTTRHFDEHLYLYDSFEGLPEMADTPDDSSYEVKTNKVWYPGAMAMPPGYEEEIRKVLATSRPAEKIHVVKGFYDRTLDTELPREKCSLVHVDCDIYTSAKYVLNKLAEKDLFQDGCVVMFDDYNCNRANPNMGERRALTEFLAQNPRWTCSAWFAYGWHAQAFIFHDRDA